MTLNNMDPKPIPSLGQAAQDIPTRDVERVMEHEAYGGTPHKERRESDEIRIDLAVANLTASGVPAWMHPSIAASEKEDLAAAQARQRATDLRTQGLRIHQAWESMIVAYQRIQERIGFGKHLLAKLESAEEEHTEKIFENFGFDALCYGKALAFCDGIGKVRLQKELFEKANVYLHKMLAEQLAEMRKFAITNHLPDELLAAIPAAELPQSARKK